MSAYPQDRTSPLVRSLDNRIRAGAVPITLDGDTLVCSVPATGDSLLTATLPEEEVLATLNRLLEHSASHHFGPGDVLTKAYHTKWEAPNTPLAGCRRVMIARRMGPHENQQAHEAAFNEHVAAVEDLLGFLGFSQYDRVHPVRGRSPQEAETTRTQTQGIEHTRTNSWIARAGVRLGLSGNGAGVQAETLAETRQETARRTGEQESKKKTLTGFEGPTRVLLGIATRYRLPTPDQLRQAVSEDSLDDCFLHGQPVSGRQRYQALRAQEIRLAQLASEFFAQVTPPDRICENWARLAREGYSADLLARINDHLSDKVDWKTRPEIEMGYHLLIYASLMRGAARQMENYLEIRVGNEAGRSPQDSSDSSWASAPTALTVVRAPATENPKGSRPLTAADCRLSSDPDHTLQDFYPPFPVMVQPDGSWAFMPDAGLYRKPHETVWRTPSPLGVAQHITMAPRFMACLEGYEPTPDDLPVAPLATPFESAERKALESAWREKLHSGDLSARIQSYRALHPISSVEADEGKPTLQ